VVAKIQLFVFVVVLALATSACGSDSGDGRGVSGQSAQELLRNAKTHLTSKNTVTISGSGTDGGTKLKLHMTYAGKTAAGTITLDGGRIRLLKSKGRAYFKGSDAFYRQAAGKNAAQFKRVVNGRWILIDAKSKDFEDLNGFVDRNTFLSGFVKHLNGNLSKGKQGRVSGVDCIALEDASGTLWVNIDNGDLVQLMTNEGQTLDFDYHPVRPAKPPKPQDVFDLSSLG
jgi:hypothetical protein